MSFYQMLLPSKVFSKAFRTLRTLKPFQQFVNCIDMVCNFLLRSENFSALFARKVAHFVHAFHVDFETISRCESRPAFLADIISEMNIHMPFYRAKSLEIKPTNLTLVNTTLNQFEGDNPVSIF